MFFEKLNQRLEIKIEFIYIKHRDNNHTLKRQSPLKNFHTKFILIRTENHIQESIKHT